MRYKCLILDHDDTVMNSTATVHYPAFLAFMKTHRPELKMSLEEYFRYNFEPGVVPLFRDICGLSAEEMKEEEQFWRSYVDDHIPRSYDGMADLLHEYKKKGGLICVISHSFSDYILRDYAHNHLPEPSLVYGWEVDAKLRKPSPWAVFEIEKKLGLSREEILILDDLKPGYDMAKAAQVDFAAAGWANEVKEIEDFMRTNSRYYFKTVAAFADFILTDQISRETER